MKKEKQTKLESLEVILWKAADKLRKNIDAAEYKHVVLGLIFLRYISDAFEAQYPPDMAELATETVLLQAEKIANELTK